MDQTPPYQTLPPASKKAWRINNSLWCLLIWMVPSYLFFLWSYNANVSFWILIAALLGAIFLTILLVIITPQIRWRQWKYKVDEHEIDLHYGIWFSRSTLVPVKRVQHVDTRQGPILRQYKLADVVISTAATTHKIPALTEATADRVRSEISTFARKAKEDV